jgi:hypothetical protein
MANAQIRAMDKELMLLPMFTLVLLTAWVGIKMRLNRDKSVREGFNWRYFKTKEGEKPPRYVQQSDSHFENMFEIPTLFYAACLAYMVMDVVDEIALVMASLFVLGRIAHAWISLGRDKLLWRARVFVATSTTLIAMWIWLIVLTTPW